MTTLQAISLDAMLALTPSALLMVWALWWEISPSKYPSEILTEDRLAFDLQDCAARVNEPLASPEAVAARVRLIMSCRILLQATGFTINMDRKPLFIDDEREL